MLRLWEYAVAMQDKMHILEKEDGTVFRNPNG